LHRNQLRRFPARCLPNLGKDFTDFAGFGQQNEKAVSIGTGEPKLF
jgi:hypothetical protein